MEFIIPKVACCLESGRICRHPEATSSFDRLVTRVQGFKMGTHFSTVYPIMILVVMRPYSFTTEILEIDI